MPGMLDETRAILEWIVAEIGSDTYPDYLPEINRRFTTVEFREAQSMARELGLSRLDERRPHLQLQRRFARR
jgi:uncharacterized Fe-S radical SAM superfamily protein PflX